MGVEYYLVCDKCKEYIDLHKGYSFSILCGASRPPVEVEYPLNAYWDGRALWFLWHHKDHGDEIYLTSDESNWYNEEPYLKEVFPHSEDLKKRNVKV